jgi:hypothetical protein
MEGSLLSVHAKFYHGRGGINLMAKFALYDGANVLPSQEFEGDYMVQDGQYVKIQVNSTNPHVRDRTVASIHLDKGQCVKEIKHGGGI